jgi:hypothetical protein
MLGAGIYLIVLLLMGYSTLSAIAGRQRRNLWRTAGTCAALGAGQMGFLLLGWSLLGGTPTRGAVCVLEVMALAATLWLWRRGRLFLPESRADGLAAADRWVIAPTVAISGVVALVALVAIRNPVIDWDAFAIWGTKARWLLGQPLTPRPALFSDLSLSYSHLDYPLLFPFLTAGAYAMAGGPIEQAGQFLCPFLLAALASILYDGIRDYLPRLPAALLVLVVLLLPQMLYFAPTGQPTLPLLVFYAASLVALARWTNSGGREHLFLLALFSAFLALTKNEGMALAAINGAAVLGVCLFRRTRRSWLDCGLGMATFVVLLLPWTLWNWCTPRTHEDYGGRLRPAAILAHHDRLPTILAHLQERLLDAHSFGWFWLLLPLLAVAGYRAWHRTDVRVLWFAWLAHISLYVLVFMVTPWDLQVLLNMISARLLLHTVPAATLIAACHWSSVRGASGQH